MLIGTVARPCRLANDNTGARMAARRAVGWRAAPRWTAGRVPAAAPVMGVDATQGSTAAGSAAQQEAAASTSAPYNYFEHWYPIAFEADIDKAAPYRFVLLGIPLAVWVSAWGAPRSSRRQHAGCPPHGLPAPGLLPSMGQPCITACRCTCRSRRAR